MTATQPATRSLLLSLITALLLFGGCATQGTDSGPASVDRAERLQRRGDNAGAATMYEQLAVANPQPARNELALAAARAWLAANRADDAQRALDLAGTGSTAAQQLEVGMLRAEVADARGQNTAAWELVSRLPQPADPAAAARLLRLRQQLALRTEQPLEAVRAGIARDAIATNDEQRTAARRELLSGLRGAIDSGLRINPGTSNEALVRGWLELAQLAADAGRSPLTADAAVARWRSRYPAHPGSTIVDSEILHPAERRRGENILPGATGPLALLLPLTGGLAAEANMIRRGFEEALARQPEAARPVLRIYDTGSEPIGTALLNAQADGAGFIIGPLLKQDAQLAYEQRPRVPLLLLNTLPTTGFIGSQIFQFALAPEDEARQIARQITGSGQRNVLVFAPTGDSPTGDWGNRVAAAFTEELTRGGGVVIAQNRYDPGQPDLTTALSAAVDGTLGIDEANARRARVQQLIGASVQFAAYPRHDIDAIFVAGRKPDAGKPDALRQINALLRFRNADRVPTYVTQDGVGTESRENRDLEGMRVLAMPWDLESVGPAATLRTATESQWRALGTPIQSRFFAFGYDAATLTMALRRGSTAWPLAGLTGRMQLTPEGRIERSMNWGMLKSGQVQPFDPAAN